jgi:hypothetical protein
MKTKEEMISRFFDEDFCCAAVIEARRSSEPSFRDEGEFPEQIEDYRKELLEIGAERDCFGQHGTDATLIAEFWYPDGSDNDGRESVGDNELCHFILVPCIGGEVMKQAEQLRRRAAKAKTLISYARARSFPARPTTHHVCILVGGYDGKSLTWAQANEILEQTIGQGVTVVLVSDVEERRNYNMSRFGQDVLCYHEINRDHEDDLFDDRRPPLMVISMKK